MEKELEMIYRNRFGGSLESKNGVWKALCSDFFQKFIDPRKDVVLDIAAGYGEFLNNIKARKKIAVDLNGDIRNHVGKDVEVIVCDCRKMDKVADGSVDKVFISNFLEHLNSTDEVIEVLKECARVLKKGGWVMILQPNIYYVREKYWFFIDHKVPLTHESLVEALQICGYEIKYLKRKFLPYTTKSAIPQYGFLVKAYLKLPFLQWVFGKQSFIIGRVPGR